MISRKDKKGGDEAPLEDQRVHGRKAELVCLFMAILSFYIILQALKRIT